MSEPFETPHRAVLSLLTGQFSETSGYRAVRRGGVGDWLLIHTLAGRGRFGHAGGDLIAEPGDWVLLRPGTPHDYGVEASLQRWDLVWAHFQPRPDWLAWLTWPRIADGLMRLHVEDATLARQFLDVHATLTGARRHREALAMNALEALLLALDEASPETRACAGDARVQRALDYLDLHLTDKVVVDDLANAVGLSPSRLAHLFKQETGQTPQAYLEARRMQVAIDLLRRTSFPIKQVAAAAGFESQFYFSQRFSRWTGLSPMAFRRQQGGG